VPVIEEDKKILSGSNKGKNGMVDLCRNFRRFYFLLVKKFDAI
jgi:hypothetical protein